MWLEENMEKFNIGDIVWSTVYGKGQIIDIPGYTQNRDTSFIAAVFYKTGKYVIFTHDGRESIEEEITLFHDNDINISNDELVFAPYQQVLRYDENDWIPEIFSHYIVKDGEYYCTFIGTKNIGKVSNVIPFSGNEHFYTKILKNNA